MGWIIGLIILGGFIWFLVWANKSAKTLLAENRQKTYERAAAASDTFGNAHFATFDEMRNAELLTEKGMTLGGGFNIINQPDPSFNRDWLLSYTGEQHLITISSPRTGKFTTAIAPALLTYPASMIVIDPKGQAAAVTAPQRERMGHKVYFLNPFKLHDLPDSGFNPLALLNPESLNFAADVAALTDAIIIPSGGGDSHWTDSASALVEALIMWVCIAYAEPSLPVVRTLLSLPPTDFQKEMKKVAEHPFFPMAQKAARFASDDFRDNQGIISTALTQTALLGEPATAQSLSLHSFDWSELKTGQATVYLILPAQYINSHSRWFRLLITSAISRLSTAEKGAYPVLFLLDEFTQLGKLSAVFNALNLSAGYGIQFWLIFQSLAVLESVYARGYEAVLATAGIIQLFRINDAMTADYFSKRTGTYTKKLSNYSVGEISRQQAEGGFTGISTSLSETAVPLLSPQKLYGWPADKGLLFANGLEYPVEYWRKPYYDRPELAALAAPDPYHLPNLLDPPTAENITTEIEKETIEETTPEPEPEPIPQKSLGEKLADSWVVKKVTPVAVAAYSVAKKKVLEKMGNKTGQ